MSTANPAMVTMVREAKAWTQSKLSTEAGMSQGFISKVESGKADLRDEALQAVARALDCPPALLIRSTPDDALTCIHNRRRGSTMTVATMKKVDATAHLTRVSVAGLLRSVNMQSSRSIEARRNSDPVTAAQEARRAWDVAPGPIDNVTGLIESAGVVIVIRSLGSASQDAVSSWSGSGSEIPLIVVNEGLPADRLRFTLAHELGHLLLHDGPTDTAEAEANQFASEFLAPGEQVAVDLAPISSESFTALLRLKEKWGMSIASLGRRAKDLNLWSDSEYREFNIALNRLGWKKFEPGTVAAEEPSTLIRLLDMFRVQGLRNSDLAAMALMTETAFDRHFAPSEIRTPTFTLDLDGHA